MASISQASGSVKCQSFPKTASTALTANNIVILSSGRLVNWTGNAIILAGIIPRAVVAADDDYASITEIPLIRLRSDATYFITTSGASATTHVGNAYDLSDGGTLNLSGTTYKQFVVVKVISSILVEVKPNMDAVTLL
jgi:hypothetical protein